MILMKRFAKYFTVSLSALLVGGLLLAGTVRPPKNPAEWSIDGPKSIAAGETAEFTLTLKAKQGVKINQYPKIRWSVAADDALVASESKVELGNDNPPPPDNMDANYFHAIDPLRLNISIAEGAAAGEQTVKTKLRYFYCVTESGFCAPARVTLEVPIRVE